MPGPGPSSAAAAGQSATELDAGRVESVLEAVLARPDYLSAPPSLLQRGMARAGAWVRDVVWSRLRDLLPAPDWGSPVWERLVMGALLIGAVMGLALLGYLLFLAYRAYRSRRRRLAAMALDSAPRPRTAAEWEAVSREAAARGDWREAALALYHAVLLRLAEAGMLSLDASKTPGDYRREARRVDLPLAGALELFLAGFERVAYARGGAGPAAFQELARAASELKPRE
jgi:hypothetical protein